jgi:hypothetical protein
VILEDFPYPKNVNPLVCPFSFWCGGVEFFDDFPQRHGRAKRVGIGFLVADYCNVFALSNQVHKPF